MKTIIIDPASTEFNRGSFCYLPYIYYSGLKSSSKEVELWENFTVADIDKIPFNASLRVALWSYPQIEICKVLQRFCPSTDILFFGYYPLIDELNLPKMVIKDVSIVEGMAVYPYYLKRKHFKHILLSDCDMHMRKYSGQVYPMFTSYGCPRSCSFCPSSVNCDKKILELSLDAISRNFKMLAREGMTNIHFTDEDFFLDPDRAFSILEIAKSFSDFNFITLAHLRSIEKFIERFGPGTLRDLGVRVIELGFETANSAIANSMNKADQDPVPRYIDIYKKIKDYTSIFWLCLTFFPGENITSLNETGEFLRKYGSNPEDLYDRIKTNSTVGGLGQFFQKYPGAPGYSQLESQGLEIDERPVRLIPSYLPFTFLRDKIKLDSTWKKETEERYWTRVYNLDYDKLFRYVREGTIMGVLSDARAEGVSFRDMATFIAILARLGSIKSGGMA